MKTEHWQVFCLLKFLLCAVDKYYSRPDESILANFTEKPEVPSFFKYFPFSLQIAAD
jgi:hypothetical protein